MNYEEEVKKVYPNAYCEFIARWDCYVIRDVPCAIDERSEDDAWESTYQTLKKQNKL